jgi:hypothetical protein
VNSAAPFTVAASGLGAIARDRLAPGERAGVRGNRSDERLFYRPGLLVLTDRRFLAATGSDQPRRPGSPGRWAPPWN